MLYHKMQAISQECWMYFLIGSCLAFLLGALSEMKIALLMIFLFGVLAGWIMNGEIGERTDRTLAEQASAEVGKQKLSHESPLAPSSATHVGTLKATLKNATSAKDGKSPTLLSIRGKLLISLGTANAVVDPSLQDPKSDSNGELGSSKHSEQANGTTIITGVETVVPLSSAHPESRSQDSKFSLGTHTVPESSTTPSQDPLANTPLGNDQALVATPTPVEKPPRVQSSELSQAPAKPRERRRRNEF